MSSIVESLYRTSINENLSDEAVKSAIILKRMNWPEKTVDSLMDALDKMPEIVSEYVLDAINGHVSSTITDEGKAEVMEFFFNVLCDECHLSASEKKALLEVLV